MGLLPLQNEKRQNRWYFGGLSSMTAALFTHPLDLLKVVLQTQKEKTSLANSIAMVYRANGLGGFYNGLSASLMRQATYTTSRLAVYEVGKQTFSHDTFSKKTFLAMAAGTMGSMVGIPMDVINVRMQNDVKLPIDQRRNYKHVGDGLAQTYREGGIAALFSGGTFGIIRGALMTIGQNAVYDEVKEFIQKTFQMRDSFPLHMCSSICAACVATVVTQPIDVLKTRKMNAKPGEFTSNLDVFAITAKEGPTAFFKGIIPAFVRLGPHTVLMFLFMEQLRLYFGYLRPQDRNN